MADGVVALAVIGGDERLERELVELASGLGDVAILPEAAADRADALLIADGQRGAALDRVRIELGARPGRRVLLIGAVGSIDPAEAMACGARAVLEYPLTAGRLREAIAASGCLDETPAPIIEVGSGPIVLLGATGGCGVTTCAAAIAAAMAHGALLDLDLAAGDAAAVARCRDRGRRCPARTRSRAGHRRPRPAGPARRGAIDACPARAGPCPSRPISSTREASRRCSTRSRARGCVAVVDAGSRVGVETLPALERASAIVIVSPPGVARASRRRLRLGGLLFRLGVADRPVGIVASRVWPHRQRSAARELAELSGLPLWAVVPRALPSPGGRELAGRRRRDRSPAWRRPSGR